MKGSNLLGSMKLSSWGAGCHKTELLQLWWLRDKVVGGGKRVGEIRMYALLLCAQLDRGNIIYCMYCMMYTGQGEK